MPVVGVCLVDPGRGRVIMQIIRPNYEPELQGDSQDDEEKG
ncbi:MAG: hypothetical protein ACPL68_05100 [Candidatus Hydrothermia bacterium]